VHSPTSPEVYLETGETISAHNAATRQLPPRYDAVWIGLQFADRADMKALIDRRVDKMAEEGLLLRITEPGSPDRYDRTERHDHLICSRCGKIADVHLPDMQSRIERALGREILSYDLKIRYICPACREQEKDNLMEEKYHER